MAVQACDSYQHLGIIRSNHRLNMAHSSVFISKPNCGMYLPSGVVLALIWSLRVKKLFSFIQLSILYLPHTSMQILLFYSFILPYISHKMLHCFPSRLCAVAHSIHSVNSISMFTCDQEKKRGEASFFFVSAFVCALKADCVHAVQWSLCGWLLSPLFPPPLPAFLPFYLLPLKQITQTQKIPCEAEINAAVIYKQSQQMHKGESPIAVEWVFLQRWGYWRACCCGTWFLFTRCGSDYSGQWTTAA